MKSLIASGSIEGPFTSKPMRLSPIYWLRRWWLQWRIDAIDKDMTTFTRENCLGSAQAVNWMRQRAYLERVLKALG